MAIPGIGTRSFLGKELDRWRSRGNSEFSRKTAARASLSPRPDASVSVPSTCAGAHASDGVSGSLSVSRSFHIKRAIMLGTLAAAAPARAIYLANAFARA